MEGFTLSKTVDGSNNINAHMKFTPAKGGVVAPPQIYRYSLRDELKAGEDQFKQVNRSVQRSILARIAEKRSSLGSSIMGVVKFATAVLGLWGAVRYRHSIPFLKDFCKLPTVTPPNFKHDMRKIWDSFLRCFNK